jgi:hypothetical protein
MASSVTGLRIAEAKGLEAILRPMTGARRVPEQKPDRTGTVDIDYARAGADELYTRVQELKEHL